MKYPTTIVAALLIGIASTGGADGNGPGCATANDVALQVLGSGGPIADDGRASAGYLLWIDGRARVMVDAGGGMHRNLKLGRNW